MVFGRNPLCWPKVQRQKPTEIARTTGNRILFFSFAARVAHVLSIGIPSFVRFTGDFSGFIITNRAASIYPAACKIIS